MNICVEALSRQDSAALAILSGSGSCPNVASAGNVPSGCGRCSSEHSASEAASTSEETLATHGLSAVKVLLPLLTYHLSHPSANGTEGQLPAQQLRSGRDTVSCSWHAD